MEVAKEDADKPAKLKMPPAMQQMRQPNRPITRLARGAAHTKPTNQRAGAFYLNVGRSHVDQ